MDIHNKIIIWGGSHHNTLGVVRSLGEKGIKSYVVICNQSLRESFVFKSKYVIEGVILHSEEDCLQYILMNYTDKINKSVIICSNDSSSSFVDLNYDKLISSFYIPNGGTQGKLTTLMNKEIMSLLAYDVGLHVPKIWRIKDENLKCVEYPCITKPLMSVGGSKNDIVICRNRDELEKCFSENNLFNKVLVQEFIERDFEFQLIGCSIDGGKKVIIPGYTKIIRSMHSDNTGFLEYKPIGNLDYDHLKCLNFIQQCNYSGLFSLEFLKAKDGRNYFLEINFRNDGNAYAVTHAGVNLPFIWVASCLNYNIDNENKLIDNSILVMPEFEDAIQVLKGKVSLTHWLNDIRRTNCFLVYNKYDRVPFFYFLKFLVGLIFNKIRKTVFK